MRILRPGGAGVPEKDALARAEIDSCLLETFCLLQAVIQNGSIRRKRFIQKIGPFSEGEGELRGDGLGNLKG